MPDPADLAIVAEPIQHAAEREGRPRTIRKFEQALRAMGFSQREAKQVAAKGFSALAEQPTQDEQLVDVLAALRRLEERMSKGN